MYNERYSRQRIAIGNHAQRMIEKAKIVVVGCGALGTHVSSHFVRMGISRIRIIEDDYVEESNLPRSAIFTERDVGRLKAVIAMERLKKVNSLCEIEAIAQKLEEENASLLDGFDIIMDCTDNMETRYIINKHSIRNQKPWIYGAIEGTEAFVSAFSGKSPCFSCVFPREMTQNRKENKTIPVFSTLPSIVSALQVTQAIKVVAGLRPQFNWLFHISLDKLKITASKIKADPFCDVCSHS